MPMSEILGKTDFELNSRRAQEHWDDEEELFKTGAPSSAILGDSAPGLP